MFFRWMKLLGPILLLIVFFLPWFSSLTASLSGMNVSTHPSNLSTLYTNVDMNKLPISAEVSPLATGLLMAAWLIPILSVLSLAFTILDRRTKPLNSLLGLLCVLLVLGYWFMMGFSSAFFLFASVGLYLLFLIGLLFFITSLVDSEDYLWDDDY